MDSQVVSEAETLLAAWRERGFDRLDPVRYHFIEALAKRAGTHSGEARRLLDQRLSELLQAYRDRGAGHTDDSGAATDKAVRDCGAHSGSLAGLASYIASQAPKGGVALEIHDPGSQDASHSELSAIDYFRDVWSRVGARQLLRQSQAQVPENAGPLNSTNLVHRSLALMRDLSPEYLHHFLSYVDALSWMEQLSDGGTPVGKEGSSAPAVKKAPRGRQR